MLKHTRIAVIIAASLSLTGCLSLGDGNDKPTNYEQAVQKEVAELLKSYRMCLQKNEDYPDKAKANCGPYRDAIQDLAPPDQKNSIGSFLERLLGKERK
jgi:hypothetical protein